MTYYTQKMYECAFKEVFMILMNFPIDVMEKIPVEEIQFFYDNMDKTYKYNIDYNKPLKNQEISEITKAILANLYMDYLVTYEEKQRIIKKDKEELELLEIEKRKKYNPDFLFKQSKIEGENKLKKDDELLPIKVKEKGIFEKIFSFIKNLLKK